MMLLPWVPRGPLRRLAWRLSLAGWVNLPFLRRLAKQRRLRPGHLEGSPRQVSLVPSCPETVGALLHHLLVSVLLQRTRFHRLGR